MVRDAAPGNSSSTDGESCLSVETDIGTVVLSWTGQGLRRVELSRDATDLSHTAAVPAWVTDLAARIAEHLSGIPRDFRNVPLDLEGAPPFFRRVWEFARSVPAGSTTTYGAIAIALGSPGAARAVGQAMARNPNLLIVPCHRVVGTAGLCGFSAAGGVDLKKHILALEGAAAGGESSTPRKD